MENTESGAGLELTDISAEGAPAPGAIPTSDRPGPPSKKDVDYLPQTAMTESAELTRRFCAQLNLADLPSEELEPWLLG